MHHTTREALLERNWSIFLYIFSSMKRASDAGEAVSNAVQAAVGELAWASVATACTWKNETSQEALRLFDPDLTALGEEQVLEELPNLSACISPLIFYPSLNSS